MCAKCLPVVHQMPKYDPMSTSGVSHSSPDNATDNDSNASDVVRNPPRRGNVTNTAPAQGSALARPVGTKKAKQLANLEQSALKQRANVISTLTPGPTSSAAALLEEKTETVGVTKELVAVFKVKTMLKEKDCKPDGRTGGSGWRKCTCLLGKTRRDLLFLLNSKSPQMQLALMCLRQLNSISASAGIPSAVDGAPQNKDHNDSASSESGDSQ
jgi:hypothetical protein